MTVSYFKNHPMYRKSLENNAGNSENVFAKFQSEIGCYFDSQKKDIKILEIWLWNWDFAYFCRENWVQDYTWIDIDDAYIPQLKQKFSGYKFIVADIVEFLKESDIQYDIIFMSHVFEHLPESVANNATILIYTKLNIGGYWINYMPNADSAKACALRHIDVTHQTIYNVNSFEQRLFMNEAEFTEVRHFNTLPAIHPIIKLIFKIIHPFFLWSTKIYYYGMGLTFPKVYTSELLSVMKK